MCNFLHVIFLDTKFVMKWIKKKFHLKIILILKINIFRPRNKRRKCAKDQKRTHIIFDDTGLFIIFTFRLETG